MEAESIDPTITSAVTEIVNRFGAPGLDQLERATGLARSGAQRAVIALVEQTHSPTSHPLGGTPAVDGAVADDSEQAHDGKQAHDGEQRPVAPELTTETSRRLADWRAASDAVRLECETLWNGLAEDPDALGRRVPTEEDRRRLYAFYAVEQAARDQFFSQGDATP